MRKLTKEDLVRLLDHRIFHQISDLADAMGIECYVIGGYVRDLFLERPSKDIDVVVAGSIGTYGILLFTALLFYYLVSSDSYGTPLLAPFSPLIKKDLRDSIYKSNIYSLDTRPAVLKSKNKTRLKVRYKEKNG